MSVPLLDPNTPVVSDESPVQTDLEHLLSSLTGRGIGFEALSAWFLLHDPEWSARFTRVWRWQDWPGNWGPDRGIDLVAETAVGTLAAIQCKHFAPEHTVTKAEIDSFLSESNRPVFSERILVATTSRLSAGAMEVVAAQEKPVSVVLRDRLLESDIDWGEYQTDRPRPAAPLTPRRHQEEAIRAVVSGFEQADRGQLLMPCGTGKTVSSAWIAERLGARRTLVLVPTLALLRQTAMVWRAQMGSGSRLLKVCSDRQSTDELAQADLTPAEAAPVTTDIDQIATFLRSPGQQVIVSTYDSSPRIGEALMLASEGEPLDLVIADEAHHCAGLEDSARKTVLDDTRIPARRRLFVTATPTVFSASAVDQAASAHVSVASMDDRARFGRVLHRLSFKQAVERGLLCPYQVVVMPVTDEEIADLVRRRRFVTADGEHVTNAFNLAAQIACLRTMHRHHSRRLVAFHPSVEQSRHFATDVVVAARLLDEGQRPPQVAVEHVDGYMGKGRREAILARFTADGDDHRLLSNVRLLAEGIDVPHIDAICLVDTHRNPSAIVQAVGRAVRTAPGKTVGTILLPVVVGADQSIESALRDAEHRPVLEVLAALRSLDTEIVNTVDAVRLELGLRPPKRDRAGTWTIDAPTAVGPDFAQAVEIELLDVLAARSSRQPKTKTGRPQIDYGDGIVLPYVSPHEVLDFNDPETLELGLLFARAWRIQHPWSPAGGRPVYQGFALRKWFESVLARWERGELPAETKRGCAEVFNWLTVHPTRHPRARRELARMDPLELNQRIEQYLWPWDSYRVGHGFEDLIRSKCIGPDSPLRPQHVTPRIPSNLPAERRGLVALRLLRHGGRAIDQAGAKADRAMVARGFVEALDNPGRGHDLDVDLADGKQPKSELESFALGLGGRSGRSEALSALTGVIQPAKRTAAAALATQRNQ